MVVKSICEVISTMKGCGRNKDKQSYIGKAKLQKEACESVQVEEYPKK